MILNVATVRAEDFHRGAQGRVSATKPSTPIAPALDRPCHDRLVGLRFGITPLYRKVRFSFKSVFSNARKAFACSGVNLAVAGTSRSPTDVLANAGYLCAFRLTIGVGDSLDDVAVGVAIELLEPILDITVPRPLRIANATASMTAAVVARMRVFRLTTQNRVPQSSHR